MRKPWEVLGITFNEWFYGDYKKDWYWKQESNKKTVESYLWRVSNYKKGLKNNFIMKSTFGKVDVHSIEKEIDWWFKKCIGANTKIFI